MGESFRALPPALFAFSERLEKRRPLGRAGTGHEATGSGVWVFSSLTDCATRYRYLQHDLSQEVAVTVDRNEMSAGT